METRSYAKEIFLKVLLNDLILDNILSNLELSEILPLRLVCQNWRTAATKRISEDKVVAFKSHYHPEEFEYIRNLKITKVVIDCWPIGITSFLYTKEELKYNQNLEKYGSQIRHLELRLTMDIHSKKHAEDFKNLFSTFPNLEVFKSNLCIVGSFFAAEFQNFVYPSLRFLNLREQFPFIPSDHEAIVNTLLKMFPNLDTNFNDDGRDITVLKLIQKKPIRIPQIRIRKFHKSFNTLNTDYLKMLMKISPISLPLTSLQLCCNTFLPPSVITGILQNFSETLTKVKLFSQLPDDKVLCYIQGEICLPPLPKARKICLGIPCCKVEKEAFKFFWNLGKNMARDFPLLEYLILNSISGNEVDVEFEETSCETWECFVPFEECEYEEIDLSSLRFLKLVDLSFPKHWIGIDESREWCEKFLQVYIKLYGNAGKIKVIQDLIDWLK